MISPFPKTIRGPPATVATISLSKPALASSARIALATGAE